MAPPPSSLIRAISYQPRSAAEVADLDGSSAGTASAQDHPSRSHHHHHHVASATASSPRRQLTLDPLSTTRSRARSVSSSNLRDSNSNIVVGDAPSATSGSVGVTAQGAREPRDVRTPDFVLGDPQQQQQAQRLHALGLGSSPARPSASASAFRPTPAQGLTSSVMDIIADGGRTNQAGPSRQRSLSDAMRPPQEPSDRSTLAPARPAFGPRLSSGLRSLFTSMSGDRSAEVPAARRPEPQRKSSDEATQIPSQRPTVQPLVMPLPHQAPLDGMRGLNDLSPPLTPASEKDDLLDLHGANEARPEPLPALHHHTHYAAPRHPWSTAQAAADAAGLGRWPFTPPLTASGRSSPARALSPPSRPNSIGAALPLGAPSGLLPSHLLQDPMYAAHARSDSPPSSTGTSSGIGSGSVGGQLAHGFLPRITGNLSNWRLSLPPLTPHLPKMLFLLIIFVGATSCIAVMLSTLPLTLPPHLTALTLSEIKDMCLSLKMYSLSTARASTHTLLVLAALFTWKQAFCVPGSLIMNVVFGAMYGTYWGTFYTSLLTSLGGVFCYLLSAPLAPLITSLPGLNKPLNAMRRALAPARARSGGKKTGGNIWTYLLVLRILPIVPYGLMNIACGVLAVPLLPYAATLAVGSIPWNFVTCQVGDILQDIVVALPLDGQSDGVFEAEGMPTNVGASGGGVRAIVERVWNREMMVKLVLLSLASALPMLLQRYLKANRPAENEDEAMAPLAGDDEENERMLERNHDGPPSWATNLEMRRPALADGDESFRQGHVREVTDPSWQDFRQSQSQISYDDIAHGSISGRFPPPERAMQRAVFA